MTNTRDPFALHVVHELLLQSIDVADAVEHTGSQTIDPEEIIIRAGADVIHSRLRHRVGDMATDTSDRAVPRQNMCDFYDLHGFSLVLSTARDPDVPLSLIHMGVVVERDRLEIEVGLVFTDAEWRGEGLGRIMSKAASQVIDRVLSNWEIMLGSLGDSPCQIDITGDAVSHGGQRLLEEIRHRVQHDLNSEDLEPVPV